MHIHIDTNVYTFSNAYPQQSSPFLHLHGGSKDNSVDVTPMWLEQLKSDHLAVFNDKEGFSVSEEANSDEIMELLERYLPQVCTVVKTHGWILNPFYNALHDPYGHLFCSYFHLCTKTGRCVYLAPGVNSVFPTGSYVRTMSLSKSKGSWKDNCLIFGGLLQYFIFLIRF